jgi:hypothetical protein
MISGVTNGMRSGKGVEGLVVTIVAGGST